MENGRFDEMDLAQVRDELKEDSARKKFDNLRGHIDELVVCKLSGNDEPAPGILNGVIDFDHIILDGSVIPFLGREEAIESIILKGNDEVLYRPFYTIGEYSPKSDDEVDKFRRDEWGNKIAQDLKIIRERAQEISRRSR